MSSVAGPWSPGRASDFAVAEASLSSEMGPCSATATTAMVTWSGAWLSAAHSSSVKKDRSVMAPGA